MENARTGDSVLMRALRWLGSRRGLAYLALMALALIVRVIIAPRIVVTQDLLTYTTWGQVFDQHPLHVYSVGGMNPDKTLVPLYPPVAMYLFGAVEKIYFGLGALFGLSLSHDLMASPSLMLAMKTPGILADLALLTILYVKACAHMRRWAAWLLGATYALSPGVLIMVVVWGQSDSIVLLLVALGLLMLARKQGIWAGALLALAVGFKPQPIIYLPLALIYLTRWGGARQALRGMVAFLLTTLAVWLPYLLPPHPEVIAMGRNLAIGASNGFPAASHTGWNLWFALGLQQRNAAAPLIGSYSLTEVSGVLFIVILMIVLLGFWRDGSEGRLWAGAAILALSFFAIGTLQYERYLFPALGLLFLAAISHRRYWLLYAVTSLIYMANYEATMFSYWDPPSIIVPFDVQRALMLYLTPWLGGVIVCLALVTSIAFFVWPERFGLPGLSGLKRLIMPADVGAGRERELARRTV
ncbi:MAG TPA: hypothetical protein VFU60_04230 [Ktedonobacterales bacterium]|nr:hypothetical protein [Ktedonobacterales bacterium]